MEQSIIFDDLHPVIVFANERIDIQRFAVSKCEVPCPESLRPCPERHDCVPRGTILDSGFGRQSHDFKHSQNNVFGTVLLSLGLLWIAV